MKLARMLTTLDFLSDGRLGAGFGLGWMREEYDALDVPWLHRGRRPADLAGGCERGRVAESGAEEALVDFFLACSTIDELLDAAQSLIEDKSW